MDFGAELFHSFLVAVADLCTMRHDQDKGPALMGLAMCQQPMKLIKKLLVICLARRQNQGGVFRSRWVGPVIRLDAGGVPVGIEWGVVLDQGLKAFGCRLCSTDKRSDLAV